MDYKKHLKKMDEGRFSETHQLDKYMSEVMKNTNWRNWKIGDWKFELEMMSGSWSWDNASAKHYVYASPFFDGMEGLPVQIQDGESDKVVKNWTEPYSVTGNPKKDIALYLATMKKILSKVK